MKWFKNDFRLGVLLIVLSVFWVTKSQAREMSEGDRSTAVDSINPVDTVKQKQGNWFLLNDSTTRFYFTPGFTPVGILTGKPSIWLRPEASLFVSYGLSYTWNLEFSYLRTQSALPVKVNDSKLGDADLNVFSDFGMSLQKIWYFKQKYLFGASVGLGLNQAYLSKADTLSGNSMLSPIYGLVPKARLTLGKGRINYWGLFLNYTPLQFNLGGRLNQFPTRQMFSLGMLLRVNF
ncbi:MAG: hypothetical protein EP332_14550 [Bacteroidetes bacterium]|nr:MAG: hypothetical protein EP332_14550 [Bacteroidota bacterium]